MSKVLPLVTEISRRERRLRTSALACVRQLCLTGDSKRERVGGNDMDFTGSEREAET